MIEGYDVSNYQADQFPTAGVDFAIIKITEGTGYTSPAWVAQRSWARTKGLVTGFYHFARPGSMADQVNYFLGKVNLVDGDFLAFDWEDSGVSSAQKDDWIKRAKAARPGVRVGLYCNTSFWLSRDTSGYAGDFLWIATGGISKGNPPIKSPWLIHQYSTANNIDHNVAQFADRAAMRAWAVGEEADVALTAAETDKIADAVFNKIFKTDGLLKAPTDAVDVDTNPTWTFQSHVQAQTEAARQGRRSADTGLAQSKANALVLSAVKDELNALGVDPEGVVARLKTFLDTLTFKIESGE